MNSHLGSLLRWSLRLTAMLIVQAVLEDPRIGPSGTGGLLRAEEPEKIRELYVPFDDLKSLLGDQTQRVFLTRAEFDALKQAAAQSPEERVPQEVCLLAADYVAELRGQRAIIRGSLTLEVLSEGLKAVPLEMDQVGVYRASLDGKPASLGRDAKGNVFLFLEGIGTHQLELSLTASVANDAAQQSLQLQVQLAATNQFRLQVPGNVEIKSGAVILSRTVDVDRNLTQFQIQPHRGLMSVVMSLNNRTLREQTTSMARGVLVAELTSATERLHATMAMSITSGATDEFRFWIDSNFEVQQVDTELLDRWEVHSFDDHQELVVKLRTPTTKSALISLRLDRQGNRDAEWKFPQLWPLGQAGYSSVLAIAAEDRLRVSDIQSKGLLAIDCEVLNSAMPDSFSVGETSTLYRPTIAAFYAVGNRFELSAQVALPPASLVVKSNTLATVFDAGLEATGGFSLLPKNEKLFSVDFDSPSDWEVDWIRLSSGQELTFERYPGQTKTRIRIRLPKGVAPNEEQTILFHAVYRSAEWQSDWETQTFDFPAFPVQGAESQEGAIAVQVQDDLVASVDSSEQLLALNEDEKNAHHLAGIPTALVYRFKSPEWRSSIRVGRTQPRLIARVMSFFRIELDTVLVHEEITYLAEQARAKQLVFSLPASTPEEVTIRALEGVRIKQTSNTVENGRRIWTVNLAERQAGKLRLAIDFVQPMTDQSRQQLPIARAEVVDYQAGVMAIEGHPELEISLPRTLREADIGELVDADYQVGKRLLGVFGYVGTADEAVIGAQRRPVFGLPATIVSRAELVSVVAENGLVQTAARYVLNSKSSYLELKLPEGASLWTVTLDGKPSLPQRESGRILVAVPANLHQNSRVLQLVYEVAVGSLGMRNEWDLQAPRLFSRDERRGNSGPSTADAAPVEIPIADANWRLILPNGYQLNSNRRNSVDQNANSWGPRLLNSLWELGGGSRNPMHSVALARSSLESDPKSEPLQATSAASSEESDSAVSSSEPHDRESRVQGRLEPEMPQEAQQANAQLRRPSSDGPRTNRAIQEQLELGLSAETAGPRSSAGLLHGGWGMQGVRSLAIELEQVGHSGETLAVSSFGTEAGIRVAITDVRRFRWMAWAVGLAVFLFGLGRKTWGTRIRYGFGTALLVIVVPLVTGWIEEFERVQLAVMAALVLLLSWYALQAFLCGGRNCLRSISGRFLSARTTTLGVSLIGLLAPMLVGPSPRLSAQDQVKIPQVDASNVYSEADANSEMASRLVADPQQLSQFLSLLDPTGPATIPDDAVVIPYDPAVNWETHSGQRLLVPFKIYQQLWDRANPERRLQSEELPALYSWAGARYEATLDRKAELRMVGHLRINQFSDGGIVVPLRLSGCVLEEATVNGRPAQMHWVSPAAAASAKSQSAKSQQNSSSSNPSADVLMLRLTGRGEKKIELKLRWQVATRGGWRIAKGIVPAAPSTALDLSIRHGNTEVGISGAADGKNHVTQVDGEQLSTALTSNGGGVLQLQWRDAVSEAVVDQGLTVNSQAVFDVQEDVYRMVWLGQLEFRRGKRESFTIHAPQDYLIERISGSNVRGWTSHESDGKQRIDIELLKAASGRETILLELSQPSAILARSDLRTDESTASERLPWHPLSIPKVTVPDAMLQQGTVTVRRSQWIELQAENKVGVSRVDLPDLSKLETNSGPLPLRPYQAYRFSQPEFQLELRASLVPQRFDVEMQSLIKISQLETNLETRLLFHARERPIHQLRIRLPKQLRIQRPQAPGNFQWAVLSDSETTDEEFQMVEIQLEQGQRGRFAIVLQGAFEVDAQDIRQTRKPVNLPKIDVLNAESQSGAIMVQADPAYEIRPENLNGCETALLSTVRAWVSEAQLGLARMVIRHPTSEYSGRLQISTRTPRVRSYAASNIRVTDQAVEETLYIEATIENAGIRVFSFLLPKRMANARIKAPMVRQKTITPLGDAFDSQVRVRLELQDDIMGQFAIMVEHDHLATKQAQSAAIPVIETGETSLRIIALENASRDELLSEQRVSVERLDQSERIQLQRVRSLVKSASEVFRVRESEIETVAPLVTFRTQERPTVETSGARIGLAQTVLSVDDLGVYRARQEYRVENRTEPFLELKIPETARIWTVSVADVPVKPAAAQSPDLIRIPLIKTAEGDLDYPVVVKYGGRMQQPGWLGTTAFPLLRTVGMRVELSQVRLRLPASYRWFNFGGTLGQVESESKLQAGWLSFRTKQISELTELLSSKGKIYSKMRAQHNLLQLEQALEAESSTMSLSLADEDLKRELADNTYALKQAQQQITQLKEQATKQELSFGNRSVLTDLYREQANSKSYNVVDSVGANFASGAEAGPTAENDASQKQLDFDQAWLSRNQLEKAANPKNAEFGVIARDNQSKSEIRMDAGLRQIAPNAPQLQPQFSGQQAEQDVEIQQKARLLGDYRLQAERYQQELERDRFSRSENVADESARRFGRIADGEGSSPVANGGQGNSMGEQLSFNGRTTEANRRARGQFGGYGGEMAGGNLPASGGNNQASENMPARGADGNRADVSLAPETGQLSVPFGLSLSNTPQQAQPQAQPGPLSERQASWSQAFLASLDVELPVRGEEILFTTPGGDLQLTAQSISRSFVSRLLSTAMVAILALVIAAAVRVCRYLVTYTIARRILAAGMLIAGIASICTAIVPLYGLVGIIAGGGLFFSEFSDSPGSA